MFNERPVRRRASAGEAPVVEIAHVSKAWPRRRGFWSRREPPNHVLRDVSFAVRRSDIVVVLGENGAGKTTLLKIACGLARPDAGTVRVLGHAAVGAAALRARVAYAGGERGFYFRLTARENLAFFGALAGLRAGRQAERIRHAAAIVDLEGELDTRFADLSSGLRQRMAIARALLGDPEVLLLDEPTRALDPPHALELRRFIRELAERCGKAIVVATNLLEEAVELGDRVAVLRAGALHFVELPERRLDRARLRALYGLPEGA